MVLSRRRAKAPQPAPRLCSNCSKLVDEGLRFCTGCGTDLTRRPPVLPPALGSGPDAAPAKPARRRAGRRWLAAAFGLWSLGLLALGLALGYLAFDRYAPRPAAEVSIIVPTSTVETSTPRAVVVPDVIDLDEQTARQAMVDAGVDPAKITSATEPRAGVPGRVGRQDPVSGTADPQAVTLFVAVPATVPDLTGRPRAEAEDALTSLGARVRRTERYQQGAASDSVLELNPAPGQPLPDEVAVVVAGSPSAAFLDAVKPLRSDCRVGAAKANGKESTHGLLCRPVSGSGAVMEYDLSRSIDVFQSDVGVTDDSAPSIAVTFDVLADGELLATRTLALGARETLTLDLRGRLRLTLRTSIPVNTNASNLTAAFLDPTVQGGTAAIDQLPKRS